MYANDLGPEDTVDQRKEAAPNHFAVIGGGTAGLGFPWPTSAKALFAMFSSLHFLLVNLAEAIKPSRLKPEGSAQGIQGNLEELAIATPKSIRFLFQGQA